MVQSGHSQLFAGSPLWLAEIETPLGPLTAIESPRGLTLLEFGVEGRLESQMRAVGASDPASLRREKTPLLENLRRELEEYFAGNRREFTIPLDPVGTEWQVQVWNALLGIPYGTTASYGDLARRLGGRAVARAVGTANGDNRIAILIPCHRVIGADGSLTGYGGGLWRKQALLALESGQPGLL